MFKKKQQEQSVSMNENYSEGDYNDMINNSFNQQPQSLPVQQPIQQIRPQVNLPPIQPKNQAMIVSIEMTQEGEFVYKVVTNYLLNIGYCNLVQ